MEGRNSTTDRRSSIGASTTDRDAEDFVRYLLEGSGAEDKVDYAALRQELENTPSRSIIKDSASERSALSFQGEPFLESSLAGTDFGESPIKGRSIDYAKSTTIRPTSVEQTSTTTNDTVSHRQSEDAKDVVIQFISRQMMANGFPPLHPSIYTKAGSDGQSGLALSSSQLEALKSTIWGILEEYQRKVEINQRLMQRVTESDRNSLELSLKANVPKAQQDTQTPAESRTSHDMALKLAQLQLQLNEKNKQLSKMEEMLSSIESDKSNLEKRILEKRKKNETSMATLIHQFKSSRGTSDTLALDIIDYYEEKLSESNSDYKSLKDQPAAIDDEVKARNGKSDNPTVRALGEQINAQLNATQASHSEALSEIELLKLKLLSNKKAEWLSEVSKIKDSGSTREMIRKDKKRWKTKSYQVENLNDDQARNMLNMVCAKLSIDNLEMFEESLDKFEQVVRLLPQMEIFIREVDQLVSNFQNKFIASNGPKSKSGSSKLNQLLLVINNWSKCMEEYADLKSFRDRIHVLLKVSQSSGSEDICISQLEHISASPEPGADAPEITLSQSAVNHFRDLFEVRSSSGVIPKMNEIYVFWAEVNAGLVRIREILSLDPSIQPGRVLIHAYEALEAHFKEPLTHNHSTRSTETIVKEVKSLQKLKAQYEEEHSMIEIDSKDEELLMNRGIDILMGQKSFD